MLSALLIIIIKVRYSSTLSFNIPYVKRNRLPTQRVSISDSVFFFFFFFLNYNFLFKKTYKFKKNKNYKAVQLAKYVNNEYTNGIDGSVYGG